MRQHRQLMFVAMMTVTISSISARANAQITDDQSFSLDAIVRLVSRGVSTEQIGRMASRYCISFSADSSAESRLVAAGADSALLPTLQRVCYAGSTLDVTTDPPGAVVLMDGDSVGTTPTRARVQATKDAFVEVRHGNWTWSGRVNLAPHATTRMRFEEPEDTLPHPPVLTATQLADSLGLLATWQAPDRPAPPPPPTLWRRARSWAVGAGATALVGYAIGNSACPQRHSSFTVDSVVFPGYVSPASQRCLTAWSFSTGVLGGYVADRYTRYRYDHALANYPKVLERWNAAQGDAREAWFLTQPAIAIIHERQLARVRQVEATNQRTLARNAGRGNPEVVVLPAD